MSKVSCQETMEKVEIKIHFLGHKFKAENLDVQVLNRDVLIVKAKDDEADLGFRDYLRQCHLITVTKVSILNNLITDVHYFHN